MTVLLWLLAGVLALPASAAPTAKLRVEGVPVAGKPFTATVTARRNGKPASGLRLRVLPESRLGAPSAVYVRHGMVTSVYGSPERPRLLVSQWRGARYGFLKVLPHGTAAEPVSLGFGVGFWVPEAHAFHYNGSDGGMYEERFYLSAPALVWAERVSMFRLEGEVSRAEALELARSLR